MTGEQPDRQPPMCYQIRVRGHLGPACRRAFPALHAETQGQDTLLQGAADQAALHGVLARIEASASNSLRSAAWSSSYEPRRREPGRMAVTVTIR